MRQKWLSCVSDVTMGALASKRTSMGCSVEDGSNGGGGERGEV